MFLIHIKSRLAVDMLIIFDITQLIRVKTSLIMPNYAYFFFDYKSYHMKYQILYNKFERVHTSKRHNLALKSF